MKIMVQATNQAYYFSNVALSWSHGEIVPIESQTDDVGEKKKSQDRTLTVIVLPSYTP